MYIYLGYSHSLSCAIETVGVNFLLSSFHVFQIQSAAKGCDDYHTDVFLTNCFDYKKQKIIMKCQL
jgi:hypothetical protein